MDTELEKFRNENPAFFDELLTYKKEWDLPDSIQYLFTFRDDSPPRKLSEDEFQYITKLIFYYQEKKSQNKAIEDINRFKAIYPNYFELVKKRYDQNSSKLKSLSKHPDIERLDNIIFSEVLNLLFDMIYYNDLYKESVEDYEKSITSDNKEGIISELFQLELTRPINIIFWLNNVTLSAFSDNKNELETNLSLVNSNNKSLNNELAIAHTKLKDKSNKARTERSKDRIEPTLREFKNKEIRKKISENIVNCMFENGNVNFSKLGKILGVSHKTASEWLKKYGGFNLK